MAEVKIATTDPEIAACHEVMRQLRPSYTKDEFVARVKLQQADGYRLAGIEGGGRVVAVAGYRIGDNLAWGRFLYVDDLVTDETSRSSGHGKQLLEWLIATAREAGCNELHLDSGVQRHRAHRFYVRHGMDITSHHFGIKL